MIVSNSKASMVATNACGPEATVCSTRVYPKEVIKYVRQQMKSLVLDPSVPVQVPKRMELDETMKAANWRDAAVRDVMEATQGRFSERRVANPCFFSSLSFVSLTLHVPIDGRIKN